MKYLLLLVVLAMAGCPDPNVVREEYVVSIVKTFKEICIHGHVYLSGMSHSLIYIPLFDDDGKPVKCKGEKE